MPKRVLHYLTLAGNDREKGFIYAGLAEYFYIDDQQLDSALFYIDLALAMTENQVPDLLL